MTKAKIVKKEELDIETNKPGRHLFSSHELINHDEKSAEVFVKAIGKTFIKLNELLQKIDFESERAKDELSYEGSALLWQFIRNNKKFLSEIRRAKGTTKKLAVYARWGMNRIVDINLMIPPKSFKIQRSFTSFESCGFSLDAPRESKVHAAYNQFPSTSSFLVIDLRFSVKEIIAQVKTQKAALKFPDLMDDVVRIVIMGLVNQRRHLRGLQEKDAHEILLKIIPSSKTGMSNGRFNKGNEYLAKLERLSQHAHFSFFI